VEIMPRLQSGEKKRQGSEQQQNALIVLKRSIRLAFALSSLPTNPILPS
jgi:hypothetical protein